jgi:hypothetical protein
MLCLLLFFFAVPYAFNLLKIRMVWLCVRSEKCSSWEGVGVKRRFVCRREGEGVV